MVDDRLDLSPAAGGAVATADPAPVASGFPSLGVGRPWRAALVAAMAVEVVVVGLLYVPIPPNPDQELYDYMAWTALTMGGLYRHGGDMNMPGEALLHIVSMGLFGNHYWSYRLLDYLIALGSMGGVALLCRKYYGDLFAGLFFGLYPVVYTTSGYWMAGQRDLVATHGILLAGFAYLRRTEGRDARWLVLAGVSVASAVLLKPTFLAYIPLQLAFAFLFARRGVAALVGDAVILGIASAAFLGIFLGLGWATDSLQSWREMVFDYSLQNYVGGVSSGSVVGTILRTVLKSWHWYTVMALAGLIGLTLDGRRAPLTVVLAVVATVMISSIVQHKGFGYHFGGLLSVISLLGAFYLSEVLRLGRKIPDRRTRYTVLSFPALLLVGGLLSKCHAEFRPQVAWYADRSRFAEMLASRHFDDVRDAADFLRSSTSPGETAWTYSIHTMINSLADRPFSGRFLTPVLVRSRKPTPLGAAWRRETEAIFRDRPPAFIILEVVDIARPDVFFNLDDIRPDEPVSVLKAALDREYVPDRRIGRFAFFRRDPARVAPPILGLEAAPAARRD